MVRWNDGDIHQGKFKMSSEIVFYDKIPLDKYIVSLIGYLSGTDRFRHNKSFVVKLKRVLDLLHEKNIHGRINYDFIGLDHFVDLANDTLKYYLNKKNGEDRYEFFTDV